jgi:hypothetical protein
LGGRGFVIGGVGILIRRQGVRWKILKIRLRMLRADVCLWLFRDLVEEAREEAWNACMCNVRQILREQILAINIVAELDRLLLGDKKYDFPRV